MATKRKNSVSPDPAALIREHVPLLGAVLHRGDLPTHIFARFFVVAVDRLNPAKPGWAQLTSAGGGGAAGGAHSVRNQADPAT